MWSSGQVLIHFHGTPSPALVALFAAGALAGFGVLRLAAAKPDGAAELHLGASPNWMRGGSVQAVAVATTLVTVAAAGAWLPPALSWVLGGMATVLGYLGIAALELTLQTPARED
jgi:hypothetical protein